VKAYFLRRLLLIPPTLLGITILVFLITRFAPGGPADRMLQEAAKGAEQGGKRGSSAQSQGGLSEDQIEELEEQFGLDKPVLVAYAQWLGVWPRETWISKGEYGGDSEDSIGGGVDRDKTAEVVLKGDGRLVRVTRDGNRLVAAQFAADGSAVEQAGWTVRIESERDRQERFLRRNAGVAGFWGRIKALLGIRGRLPAAVAGEVPGYRPRAVVCRQRLSGLLQGDLGRSSLYNEPVIDLILSRVPVAVYFGLLSAVITYGVCLPLGVLKALKHRTFL
jgi:microcin C transport system permease protein